MEFLKRQTEIHLRADWATLERLRENDPRHSFSARYALAYIALKEFALCGPVGGFNEAAGAIGLLSTETSLDCLRYLRDLVGTVTGDSLPLDSLHVDGFEISKGSCIVITMPPPQVVPEAYMVGITTDAPLDQSTTERTSKRAAVHYVSLEYTYPGLPLLCGWKLGLGPSRKNYGIRVKPTIENFVDVAEQLWESGKWRLDEDKRSNGSDADDLGNIGVTLGVQSRALGALPRDLQAKVISGDGRHFAVLGVLRPGKVAVFVDGQQGPTYDWIATGSLLFSPDGKRLAYGAYNGQKFVVVMDLLVDDQDGLESDQHAQGKSCMIQEFGLGYDQIANCTRLSPLVCQLIREGPEYDQIANGTLLFSPDGKRLAYGAQKGQTWLVTLDGQEGKAYDGIAKGSLVFSPDSKRLAYSVCIPGQGGRDSEMIPVSIPK